MAVGEAMPWYLYREIHKAMRLALFGMTALVGSTDGADEVGMEDLLAEWDAVRLVLTGHHEHEDTFCDALVQQHAPDLREELEAAHRETDATLAVLQHDIDHIEVATSSVERTVRLQKLHLDLSDFTAAYLGHLRFEEDRVMPALNAAMTDDELAAVTDAIRGAVPPPDMCVFIRYMVPAMTFSERVDLLGGMHAGAPPEVFELFRDAAEGCLDPADYAEVAAAAGFA